MRPVGFRIPLNLSGAVMKDLRSNIASENYVQLELVLDSNSLDAIVLLFRKSQKMDWYGENITFVMKFQNIS